MERFTLAMDVQTIAKLIKICKSMNRTRSGAIRQLIKEYEVK